ncbi:hypothetical protein ILYODFUR_010641 [Ilyodon furcidens]|uniref:Uncharacterized protein n=1 Tax=Ilyodon furcidens TaxID=33524 RepID=A0ABV0VCY8_9TELE
MLKKCTCGLKVLRCSEVNRLGGCVAPSLLPTVTGPRFDTLNSLMINDHRQHCQIDFMTASNSQVVPFLLSLCRVQNQHIRTPVKKLSWILIIKPCVEIDP